MTFEMSRCVIWRATCTVVLFRTKLVRTLRTSKDSKQSLEIHGDVDIHWKTIIIALHARTHARSLTRTHTHTHAHCQVTWCNAVSMSNLHIVERVFISHEPLVDVNKPYIWNVMLCYSTRRFNLHDRLILFVWQECRTGKQFVVITSWERSYQIGLQPNFWSPPCGYEMCNNANKMYIVIHPLPVYVKQGRYNQSPLANDNKFNLVTCFGIIRASGFKII